MKDRSRQPVTDLHSRHQTSWHYNIPRSGIKKHKYDTLCIMYHAYIEMKDNN